jgi:hypothetical protein
MKGWLFTGAHPPLRLIEHSDPEAGPEQTVGLKEGGVVGRLAATP